MNKSLAFVEREKEIEQLHSLHAVTLFVPFTKLAFLRWKK